MKLREKSAPKKQKGANPILLYLI